MAEPYSVVVFETLFKLLRKETLSYIDSSDIECNPIKYEVLSTSSLFPSIIIYPFMFSSPNIKIPIFIINKGESIKEVPLFKIISFSFETN